jgi:phage repressor protein C with HTH and peptisase S24 domain
MNAFTNIAAAQCVSQGSARTLPVDGPLQLVQVRGDAMQPTYRGDRDFVLIAPCDRFLYDHVYVVRDDVVPDLLLTFRVQAAGGRYWLIRDNPAYGKTPDERSDEVSRELFNKHVVGIVVASLLVHDEDIVRRAWKGEWK